ncbi:MAG: recombination mediator RecR [Bacteroidales bacterium]
MLNTYPSKLLENAVIELSRLPGIGRKTALRLCLHMLSQPEPVITRLGQSLIDLRQNIRYCTVCHNISDDEVCSICSDTSRDESLVCVVESARDVMAIENTGQFRGLYHVLGGKISPFEGKSPADLNIESLTSRVAEGKIAEIVFALPANMEGDTTVFYIYKKLKPFDVRFSTIARGVAVGDELEYTDEVTLGRSILNRQPYEASLNGI